MSAVYQKASAYTKVDIETASQGKLIVMLFNGAIKRAEEAKRQLAKGNRQEVHNNLIRAQEIIAELRGALNMKAGAIATNLDRIYEYFQHLLITANLRKQAEPIDQCVTLMNTMRDTWQEVFDKIAQEEAAAKKPVTAPPINQHGNSMLNMQG
ncbi:MAG: flagellar export chaperone FliS [Candidatus Hydrogenedentota bacterium]